MPLLAKPATKNGVALMRKIGLSRESSEGADGIGDSFRLERPEGFSSPYGLE
jgi:hypothetical protein